MSNDNIVAKKSDIRISVSLNADKHPIGINWQADDSGIEGMRDAKAFMIALWDKPEKSTMRIDLWTKEMSIDEMKKFFHQNVMTLTDTYAKATNDEATAKEVKEFFSEIGKKIGVLV